MIYPKTRITPKPPVPVDPNEGPGKGIAAMVVLGVLLLPLIVVVLLIGGSFRKYGMND